MNQKSQPTSPTPGEVLTPQDVALLSKGDVLKLAPGYEVAFSLHANGESTVEDVDPVDDTITLLTPTGKIDYFGFATMPDLFVFVSRPAPKQPVEAIGAGRGYSEAEIEVAAQALVDHRWNGSQPGFDRKPPSWKAEHVAEVRAILAALSPASLAGPELTVWYGKMPESNGRENWTAELRRVHPIDKWDRGFCFARSEYPGRVLYEADRVRWIIGERAERPDILAYDADAHSGYVEPASPARTPMGEPVAWIERQNDGTRYGEPKRWPPSDRARSYAQEMGRTIEPLYAAASPARTLMGEPQVLKGVGKINGDGWKDTTTIGEVVYVWNAEKPSPYAPGQYPRIDNEGWSASTAQYDFSPASVDEVRALAAPTPMGESQEFRASLEASIRRAGGLTVLCRTAESRKKLIDLVCNEAAALAAPTPMGGEVEALREAVRLALEDADALERIAEEADDNQWPDWSATMRQAALRIKTLAASSPSPAQGGIATWHPLDDNGMAEVRINGKRITTMPSYPGAEEVAQRINAALAASPQPEAGEAADWSRDLTAAPEGEAVLLATSAGHVGEAIAPVRDDPDDDWFWAGAGFVHANHKPVAWKRLPTHPDAPPSVQPVEGK